MIPRGSSAFKEAVCHPSHADDQPERVKIMESEAEFAPTAENFGIVTDTALPYGSGSTPIVTKEGICRDSRSEPRQLPEEILVEIIRLASSGPRSYR
ncbi:hypothetical protein FRC01_010108, partial [Tulasnella sp. 417]